VKNKKKELMCFPLNSKRPHVNTPFGKSLITYTKKSSSSYDEAFSQEIRNKYPHWFQDINVQNKKQELLLFPLNSKRPKKNTSLGNALADYIKKGGPCYDENFSQEIRNKFPNWFKILIS
jgi:hypothetical protein